MKAIAVLSFISGLCFSTASLAAPARAAVSPSGERVVLTCTAVSMRADYQKIALVVQADSTQALRFEGPRNGGVAITQKIVNWESTGAGVRYDIDLAATGKVPTALFWDQRITTAADGTKTKQNFVAVLLSNEKPAKGDLGSRLEFMECNP